MEGVDSGGWRDMMFGRRHCPKSIRLGRVIEACRLYQRCASEIEAPDPPIEPHDA